MKSSALVAFSLAACLSACQAPVPTKESSHWWEHVENLASDRMQGRLTGSEGYMMAAGYVADAFHRLGLEPAGADGYFQPVSYEVQSIRDEGTSFALSGQSLALGDDLVLAAGVEQLIDVTAPLVFIGYGLNLPDSGHDDFAGIDLRGKIAVYVSGAPAGISGPLQAYARAEQFAKALHAAGAVGAISLQTPAVVEVPWERIKLNARQPGMYLTEPDLRRFRLPALIGQFNPDKAGKLFARAPQDFAAIAALADAHQPVPRFPLNVTLSAHVNADHARVSANNVVAELPGNDTALANQAVVLSAHLDHLGTGVPDHGDGIFHGAMDNASGIASLLEVARMMREAGSRPKRSILFVAVAGEEKGLLGSRFFAAHPSRHVGQLAADINMDMFLPLYPLHDMVAYGADESTLGKEADQVAAQRKLALVPDPAPDHLIFVRSDQYSFIRSGVPSLMLAFSPAPGTDQAAIQKTWFHERYHAQADDLTQPVDVAAADDFNRYLSALIARIADAPDPPHWLESSFFRRFAETPLR